MNDAPPHWISTSGAPTITDASCRRSMTTMTSADDSLTIASDHSHEDHPKASTGRLAGDDRGGRYWDRTSDRFVPKAASSRCVVPSSVGGYAVTWTYVSGRTAWCWRLLESLFPLCSLRAYVITPFTRSTGRATVLRAVLPRLGVSLGTRLKRAALAYFVIFAWSTPLTPKHSCGWRRWPPR
jgi:hypothetical protein